MPFSVEFPGIYSAEVVVGVPLDNMKAQLDVRPEGTADHYATADLLVPNTGDWAMTGIMTATDIPLRTPGAYILRIRNVTLLHTTADNREPGYENDSVGAWRPNAFNFGPMTLTRTGDLPAMATLSGKVTASDLGGMPVEGAYVMANAGASVGEPGPMWQQGYWTRTNAQGNYTLSVPEGTYTVQAGLPSMFAFPGATASAVSVGAGGQITNLDLPSRYTKTTDGRYTVQVETEYFVNKIPDTFNPAPGSYQNSPVVIQGRPVDSNGINAGFIDVADWIDVPVVIPAGQGGAYLVSDLYFNGYWDGVSYPEAITRFTANPGTSEENSTEAVEPNTAGLDDQGQPRAPWEGYNRQGRVDFATPLTLKEGLNIVRVTAGGVGGTNAGAAWDAFILTQESAPIPPAGAKQVLRVAAGLEAAPSPASGPAFTALNVETSGDSATKIDVLDAVKLAKEGKI